MVNLDCQFDRIGKSTWEQIHRLSYEGFSEKDYGRRPTLNLSGTIPWVCVQNRILKRKKKKQSSNIHIPLLSEKEWKMANFSNSYHHDGLYPTKL